MRLPGLVSVLFLIALAPVTSHADAQETPNAQFQADFEGKLKPFLSKYCLSCHGAEKPKAGLNLAKFDKVELLAKDRKIWQRASEYMASGEMPPDESAQPKPEEAEAISGWIEGYLTSQGCKPEDQSPGRVTLRRLNRVEYRNTIRDLVGVDYKPTDEFPSDDVGYGFDNIGDVLTLSPVLMEKYFAAAEQIAEEAINADANSKGMATPVDLDRVKATEAVKPFGEGGKYFISNGTITFQLKAEKPGEYRVQIRAWGDQGGDEPARMKVEIAGQPEELIDVKAIRTSPGSFEVPFSLKKPANLTAKISFVNDAYVEKKEGKPGYDRNLLVESVQLVGPAPKEKPALSDFHKKTFACHADGNHADDCSRKIISKLTERSYRRPPRSEEIGRLTDLFNQSRRAGETFESGVQLALKAMLISPHFLFKMEADPGYNFSAPVRKLSDYELATRLSYFLHSSMPDDELYELAKSGRLQMDGNLDKQIQRMLKSQRINQFVDHFGMQWLQLRNLPNIGFDRKRFPSFDGNLRRDFMLETRQFLSYIIREDRSVLELLDADYTFVNENLAKHYGIKDVQGRQFRKVSLDKASGRGGLITQASILAVTSNPTRTSPVKRGRWILEQILGTPPPAPPPNVPELKADDAELAGTLRQKMEQHRKDPACANCHAKMDPLGFGLENFDAVGSWRTLDGKDMIDPTGELPSGEKFSGPAELKVILLGRKKEFVRNLVEKMLIYSLGRGLDSNDQCAVEEIAKAVEKDGYKFSRLVMEIVRSEPFQKRLTAKAKS
ncbi:MAG: DUF1592 domain-containing protein [Isosphaeraceae bacterium]